MENNHQPEIKNPIPTDPNQSVDIAEVNNSDLKSGIEVFDKFQLSGLKSILLEKINKMSFLFHFNQSYSTSVIHIFSTLTEITNRKITYTLNHNKNYLKFFKDISLTYQRFSTDLIKASTELSDIKSKDHIVSDGINNMIGMTQESIANNFYSFSNVLLTSIVTKGPLIKINDFYKRLNSLIKEINNNLEKITTQKEKIFKIFNTKYSHIFDQFKKQNLNESNIIYKYDFYLIVMDLITHFNLMNKSFADFFANFKNNMTELRKIIYDYLNIVKESMEIYINENSKIFTGNMNLNFETIHKFYESFSKESLEMDLNVSKILKEEEIVKLFNESLKEFQLVFLKSNFGDKDDIYYDDEKFKINNFKTMDEFVELFESLNPEQIEANDSSLIENKIELKRDPGIFKSWKNCHMIITRQNNVLVFDEEIKKEKFVNAVNLKKIQFKQKEDKKHPFRFEISEVKKGMLYNSSTSFYLDAGTREKYEEVSKMLLGNNKEQISKQEDEVKE